MTTPYQSPRTKGYNAAQGGLPESACPYPIGARKRVEWRAGYWAFVQEKPRDGRPMGYRHEKREATDPSATRRRYNDMLGGKR